MIIAKLLDIGHPYWHDTADSWFMNYGTEANKVMESGSAYYASCSSVCPSVFICLKTALVY